NKGKYTLQKYYSNDSELDKKVDGIFNSLSDDQRIGQMIIVAAGEYGKSQKVIDGLIKKQIIGAVLLLKGSSNEFENMNSHFNILAEISNCPPLFVSSDSEPTLINKKISGLPSFMAANEVRSVTECRILASDIAIAI